MISNDWSRLIEDHLDLIFRVFVFHVQTLRRKWRSYRRLSGFQEKHWKKKNFKINCRKKWVTLSLAFFLSFFLLSFLFSFFLSFILSFIFSFILSLIHSLFFYVFISFSLSFFHSFYLFILTNKRLYSSINCAEDNFAACFSFRKTRNKL